MPSLVLTKKSKFSIPIPSVWGLGTFLFFMVTMIGGRYPQLGSLMTKGVIPLFFLFVLLKFKNPFKGLPKELYTFVVLWIWSLLTIFVVIEIPWYIKYNRVMLGIILLYFIINKLIFYKEVFEYINWAFILSTIYVFVEIFILRSISITEFLVLQQSGTLFYTKEAVDGANEVGGQVLISLLSVLFLSSIYKERWKRVLMDVLAVIVIMLAILTGSRGALVPALFAYLFYLGFIRFKINVFAYVILIIIVGVSAYFLVDFITENTFIGHKLDNMGNSNGDKHRTQAVYEGIEMFLSNPITGVGAGNFIAHFSIRLYSHNDYIEMISTLGAVGAGIYLTFYLQMVKRIFRLRQFFKRIGGNDQLQSIFLVAIFSCLLHGLSKPLFVDMGFMSFFAVISAYSNKLYYTHIKQKS